MGWKGPARSNDVSNPTPARRAHQGTAPKLEARNYWLPQPQWAEEFIEECAAFPNGAHDDQVDTWSQAAARFRGFYTGIMDYYRAAALVVDAGKASETPAELVN